MTDKHNHLCQAWWGHPSKPALTRQTRGWGAPASLGHIERPYLQNQEVPTRKRTHFPFCLLNLKTTNLKLFVHVTHPWNPLTALKNDGLGLVVMCSPSTVDAHATFRELVSKPNKNKKDQAFSVLFD